LTFSEAIFPGAKENYREAFIRRERRENREGKTAGETSEKNALNHLTGKG